MPRKIFRTVEPEKVLACHSLEKRWTRAKPSRAMSLMVCKVSGKTRLQATCRSSAVARPSAVIARKAGRAAPGGGCELPLG